MSRDIYGPDWEQRSRIVKQRADWHCVRCWRAKRRHAWQVWRPEYMHAHHLFRAHWSPLVCLCESCHRKVHRFDRENPFPLAIDTWMSIAARWIANTVVIAGATILLWWLYR